MYLQWLEILYTCTYSYKRGPIIKRVITMTPDPHIHMYIFVINGGSSENAYINHPVYIINMNNNPIYIYVINGSPLYNLYLQLSIIYMNVINLIHREHMYAINYIFMFIYSNQIYNVATGVHYHDCDRPVENFRPYENV